MLLKSPPSNPVRLVTVTPDAEKHIIFCARVSNPNNQLNEDIEGLIKYCVKHGHWSPFEQATMTVEIVTSRAISAQILRHRSFSFQEFSQRYSPVTELLEYQPRMQGSTNRQVGDGEVPYNVQILWDKVIREVATVASLRYKELLDVGVAKESARMILPMCSKTVTYMTGSVRSWIHYLQLRTAEDTQKEHRDIANSILEIFKENFPITARSLCM